MARYEVLSLKPKALTQFPPIGSFYVNPYHSLSHTNVMVMLHLQILKSNFLPELSNQALAPHFLHTEKLKQ